MNVSAFFAAVAAKVASFMGRNKIGEKYIPSQKKHRNKTVRARHGMEITGGANLKRRQIAKIGNRHFAYLAQDGKHYICRYGKAYRVAPAI